LKRIIILLLIAIITLTSSAAYANELTSSYIYDFQGNPVHAPAAYRPTKIIDGKTLGTSNFNTPTDIFVAPDKYIYVADSGNDRIVVLNKDFELYREISEFKNKGKTDKFNKPHGVFVAPGGDIYVADTENARIVQLDSKGAFVKEFGVPKADIIPADFKYRPMSLVVDKAKRMYVIASGVNKGIMELDNEGGFRSYMGASQVTPNMLDYFWKKISTDEQRARMELFIPTEYNNINIDEDGFIYVTTSTISEETIGAAIETADKDARERGAPVRKLNPTGSDVLRRLGNFPPVGDIWFEESKHSLFIDVCLEENGIYSVLDGRMGRVFTYDNDSNLLYIFGGIGNLLGAFKNPAAIDSVDGNYIVLDSDLGQITIFEPTEYGRLLKEAVTLHQQGRYDASAAKWQEVLNYNANSELAYIGLGKAYLRKDNYSEAMKYFKLGNKRNYYSKAFQLYRKQVIGDKFALIMTVIIVGFTGTLILRRRKVRKEVGL